MYPSCWHTVLAKYLTTSFLALFTQTVPQVLLTDRYISKKPSLKLRLVAVEFINRTSPLEGFMADETKRTESRAERVKVTHHKLHKLKPLQTTF